MKNFFKKLEYHFLVESKSFPFKTALSETNVKTNEWQPQNGPILKTGVLPVITLLFWKFFPVLEPLKKS